MGVGAAAQSWRRRMWEGGAGWRAERRGAGPRRRREQEGERASAQRVAFEVAVVLYRLVYRECSADNSCPKVYWPHENRVSVTALSESPPPPPPDNPPLDTPVHATPPAALLSFIQLHVTSAPAARITTTNCRRRHLQRPPEGILRSLLLLSASLTALCPALGNPPTHSRRRLLGHTARRAARLASTLAPALALALKPPPASSAPAASASAAGVSSVALPGLSPRVLNSILDKYLCREWIE